MKKFAFFTVILLLLTSLIYADSSKERTTTLKIEGYKLANMPANGILRVYVYDTSLCNKDKDVQNSKTAINNQIELTDYISDYSSDGCKDVFRIDVQTNLARTITITITVNPFVYWKTSTNENGGTTKTAESVLPTSYMLTSKGGTYTYNDTYKYTSTVSTSSEATTLGKNNSTASASTTAKLTLSAQQYSKRGRGRWVDVTPPVNDDNEKVLKYIEDNATIDSSIYVKMKVDTTNITPNVQYVAPIIITVSSST